MAFVFCRATAFKVLQKDVQEADRIQGYSKVLFLYVDPAAKTGVLAKGEVGFAQDIQVERRYIFSGLEIYF